MIMSLLLQGENININNKKKLLLRCLLGLRKVMLRAHRQAWCWQDEYYGLQLEDIRKLELETQMELKEKMAAANCSEDIVDGAETAHTSKANENVNAVKNDSNETAVLNSVSVQKSRSLDNALSKKVQPQGRESPALSVSSTHSNKSRKRQLSRSKTSLGK